MHQSDLGLVEDAASSSAPTDTAGGRNRLAQVGALPRLLIVDDEAPQLQALCSLLEEIGYDVTGCSSPDEALDLLNKQSFDVLLSDLMMPGIDGIALMQRALEADPDVIPVLMTGHGTVDNAVAAMKVGALDFVLKPFRLSAITPVINRALEVRSLRVRNRELLHEVTRHAKRLEAANRELDSFAARVAHDLRAPLNIMQGFTRVVMDSGRALLDERDRDYLRRVVDAGLRAERLIDHLLAFARLGESPMRSVAVDLGAIVEQARDNVCGLPENTGREIEWVVRPLPAVVGDPELLHQVFFNLLANAVKYTRCRAVARIDIEAMRCLGAHEIWIRDNGAGFNPDYSSRLFSPFQRLHSNEEFEGTGMGLANVKRIVERHGGAVRAESRPGQGAAFMVALPAR